VVFDTTVVVSALLFTGGRLAWLRGHWRAGNALPLASRATVEELARVLRYPKFQLSSDHRDELLAEYLPYCEIIQAIRKSKLSCRDKYDQPFLDLAESGKADLLVTGDRDLLALAGQARFFIETPSGYRARVSGL